MAYHQPVDEERGGTWGMPDHQQTGHDILYTTDFSHPHRSYRQGEYLEPTIYGGGGMHEDYDSSSWVPASQHPSSNYVSPKNSHSHLYCLVRISIGGTQAYEPKISSHFDHTGPNEQYEDAPLINQNQYHQNTYTPGGFTTQVPPKIATSVMVVSLNVNLDDIRPSNE
ncbi:hypothetical protein H4Q26_008288 [Puccinia striiformis f. sp. tritici PST-130]|nr:hypothetical protein H4Q26_008288 [Puccinia striiformis f. sp. tritici PST-130]